MSSINVTNNSGNTIEVAVNHWGTGGNVSFYRIGDKKKKTAGAGKMGGALSWL
jgi:hypothetical protein